jgi:hypothetical protein
MKLLLLAVIAATLLNKTVAISEQQQFTRQPDQHYEMSCDEHGLAVMKQWRVDQATIDAICKVPTIKALPKKIRK